MAWVDFPTYTEPSTLDEDDLNQFSDNLDYLFPGNVVLGQVSAAASNLTTTSGTYVIIGGASSVFDQSISMPVAGLAMVIFKGEIALIGGTPGVDNINVDLFINGVRVNASTPGNGLIQMTSADRRPIFLMYIVSLNAGSNDIEVQWKTSGAGTATLYASTQPFVYIKGY